MLSRTPKTPAPASNPVASASKTGGANGGQDAQPSLTGSPMVDGQTTPAMNLSFRGSDLGVSLKDQHKVAEETRRENFTLKLQINELQSRLAKLSTANVEKTLKEHSELAVKNEALASEIRTYKELLFEAQQELDQLRSIASSFSAQPTAQLTEELQRMRAENDAIQTALTRSQATVKRMEQQLLAAEEEARQQGQRARQLELELSTSQRRILEASARNDALTLEITDLGEQVRLRREAAERARSDYTGTAAEVSALTRQVGELQTALRRSETERFELATRLQAAGTAGNGYNGVANGSGNGNVGNDQQQQPRSSIDMIESRLMRELGAASKKLSEMEKKTHLSSAERDQLMDNLRRQSEWLSLCSNSIGSVICRLNEHLTCPIDMAGAAAGMVDAAEWPAKMQLLEQVAGGLCQEVAKDRESLRGAERELHQAADAIEALDRDREHLSANLSAVSSELASVKQDLLERNRTLLNLQEQNRQLTLKMKASTEEEIPLLKAEIEHHKQHIADLNRSLDDAKRRMVEAESRNFESARRIETLNAGLNSAAAELADSKRSLQLAVKERDEAIARQARAESDLQHARRCQDDFDAKLSHQHKVRAAVEEQFQSELKQLHSANSELKVQLQAAEKSRADDRRRSEGLQRALAELQESMEASQREGMGRGSELSKLRQEAEMLRIERDTLESELIEKQSMCKRLESDLGKLRREEAFGKRNEAMEHLQAKVESLQALNTYLKEQAEVKERAVAEMEERVRQQEDQVRAAFAEVDAQNKKLKKRELLINQALKRLEAINTIKGAGGGTPLKQTEPAAMDDEF